VNILFIKNPGKYEAAQLVLTLIRRNISWAANRHIRMFSEGSCDWRLE